VYDARLKLAQPAPAVVLRTEDADAARTLGASLRARGHDVVALDESAAPEARAVRAFRFGDASLEADGAEIAYASITAFVRAARTVRSETIERVTERKLRPGMALATGGLVMSKKVVRNQAHIAHTREDLLFVFGAAREAWIVSERGTKWAALDSVAPSQRENFLRVVAEIRARAPNAPYDERLLAHKNLDDTTDIALRARMLAISLSRK
jgi:hypothetical protein